MPSANIGNLQKQRWLRLSAKDDEDPFMSGDESLKRVTKIITAGYMAALGLLAALTLGIHFLLNEAVDQLQHAGKVVNVAGAQRMLSQRIYWLTEEMLDKPGSPALLEQAIDRFESSHRALLYGDFNSGLPDTVSEALRDYYFEEPHNVDQKVREYVNLARSALQIGVDEVLVEDMRALAATDLLASLDAAVQAYEDQANQNVARLQQVQTLSVIAVILVLLLEAVFIFRPLVSRVKLYATRLYDLATRDPMTGLSNRRHFLDAATRSLRERARHKFPVSLIMFDIDRFKSVNDTYGHQTGDDVIVRTSDLATELTRDPDVVGRLGGEEFAILLSHTDLEGAQTLAERLRQEIEKDGLAVADAPDGRLFWTVSGGVVEVQDDETVEQAISRADLLLYDAKRGGRNQMRADPNQGPDATAALGNAVASPAE